MVELTTEKIDTAAILENMEDQTAGGVVFFIGKVRDHNEDRKVIEMDYDAYPEMARAKMQEIEDETKRRWPVKQMTIVHRYGNLKLGDISVAIAVACAHRKDAFEACRFAIDTLKATVPIWKKEYFENGDAWVEGVIPGRDSNLVGGV